MPPTSRARAALAAISLAVVLFTLRVAIGSTRPHAAFGSPDTLAWVGSHPITAGDLSTPAINVAYGSYYLRYLLDHYSGNEVLALAAYNGGVANVDGWVARAQATGRTLTLAEIPFGETRAYVRRVLAAQREYRTIYPRELGLA